MKTTPSNRINKLLVRATDIHQRHFNTAPQFAAAAPGRVNLIGEHTDYNNGLVMPFAIDRYTLVVASLNQTESTNNFIAGDLDELTVQFNHNQPLKTDDNMFANYLKGVIQQFLTHNHTLPAVNAVLVSDVPIGSGLSSSAALCVSTTTMLQQIINLTLDPMEKAKWCQKVEHDFANVPCGLMDHCISAIAKQDHALILNCDTLETKHVPLNTDQYTIMVVHSGISHSLAGGEYAKRRAQCETAVQELKQINPAITSLSKATRDELETLKQQHNLDDTIYRRARHIITENKRVIQLQQALEAGDLNEVGQAMYASHDSLKNDYEVSCPELDLLVDLAQQHQGIIGSRMTGGGFGGCTVNLIQPGHEESFKQHIQQNYHAQTNVDPMIFNVHPAKGAHNIALPQ